jgi:hypothetical protein
MSPYIPLASPPLAIDTMPRTLFSNVLEHKVICSPMNAQVIVLKTVLEFALK